MFTIWLSIALVGIFWGGWPLVARSAGVTGVNGAFLLGLAALIPTSLIMLKQGVTIPTGSESLKLLLAGCMMGLGLIAYNFTISNPLVEISTVMPIVSVLMIVVTSVGGILFFSEDLTIRKTVGILLTIVVVYLLRPNP